MRLVQELPGQLVRRVALDLLLESQGQQGLVHPRHVPQPQHLEAPSGDAREQVVDRRVRGRRGEHADAPACRVLDEAREHGGLAGARRPVHERQVPRRKTQGEGVILLGVQVREGQPLGARLELRGSRAREQLAPADERLRLAFEQAPQPGLLALEGDLVGQQLQADPAGLDPLGRRAVERDRESAARQPRDDAAQLLVALAAAARDPDDRTGADLRRGDLPALPGGAEVDEDPSGERARVGQLEIQERVPPRLPHLERRERPLGLVPRPLLAPLDLEQPLQGGDVLGEVGHAGPGS